MNTASQLCLHDVDRIETQLRCTNGQWNTHIKISAGTHELDIVLYGRDGIAPDRIERADEYVRVEDSKVRVERSDKPFEGASR